MPRNKSGSINGGVIGKTNITSFGKNTQTVKTSSTPSAVTTQPGTRLVQTAIVAGGGGGGGSTCGTGIGGAGGGAGGVRNLSDIPVNGNSALGAVTIGGAGSGGSRHPSQASQGGDGSDTSIVIGCTTYTSSGGGGGGARQKSPIPGSTGTVGTNSDGRAGGAGGGAGAYNYNCLQATPGQVGAGNEGSYDPPEGFPGGNYGGGGAGVIGQPRNGGCGVDVSASCLIGLFPLNLKATTTTAFGRE